MSTAVSTGRSRPLITDAGLVWRALGLIPALVLLALVLTGSMLIGAQAVAPSEVWHFLLQSDSSNATSNIVWESRVPRTVIILIAGAAFGVAGSIMQAVTRNPLTDPGILGVNSGASLAIVIGLAFFGMTDISQYMWWALLGALITSVVVFLVGNSGHMRGDPIKLTLAGVALAAVLGGFTSAVLLTDSQLLNDMRGWAAGTTANQPLHSTLAATPVVVIGLILALLLGRSLDVLALGEATAIAMGAHPTRIRIIALVAVALLAGGATAVMGPVAFIGLLTPHLCRLVVGAHQGWIMAYSIIVAPIILAVADVIGRVISSGEIPVGVVTPFIGGPLLIYMVRRLRVSAQ